MNKPRIAKKSEVTEKFDSIFYSVHLPQNQIAGTPRCVQCRSGDIATTEAYNYTVRTVRLEPANLPAGVETIDGNIVWQVFEVVDMTGNLQYRYVGVNEQDFLNFKV